jgi:ABC-type transport system involved in Fe-S cluster assembly fused permease/ATPase subunit
MAVGVMTIGLVTEGLVRVCVMAVGLMSVVVMAVDLVTVGVVTVGFVTVGLMTVELMAVLNFNATLYRKTKEALVCTKEIIIDIKSSNLVHKLTRCDDNSVPLISLDKE